MTLTKKTHPRFYVPNFGAKKRSRVKERWRKQRGDDSKKRLKKDFAGAEPNIGYGNPWQLRGVRQSGKRAVLIHNEGQLRELMANPEVKNFEITFGTALSKRKRATLLQLATSNKIHVTNGGNL